MARAARVQIYMYSIFTFQLSSHVRSSVIEPLEGASRPCLFYILVYKSLWMGWTKEINDRQYG